MAASSRAPLLCAVKEHGARKGAKGKGIGEHGAGGGGGSRPHSGERRGKKKHRGLHSIRAGDAALTTGLPATEGATGSHTNAIRQRRGPRPHWYLSSLACATNCRDGADQRNWHPDQGHHLLHIRLSPTVAVVVTISVVPAAVTAVPAAAAAAGGHTGPLSTRAPPPPLSPPASRREALLICPFWRAVAAAGGWRRRSETNHAHSVPHVHWHSSSGQHTKKTGILCTHEKRKRTPAC